MARASLRGKWCCAALATLVFVLMVLVMNILTECMTTAGVTVPATMSALTCLWALLVTGPITFAFSGTMLAVNRGTEGCITGQMFGIFRGRWGAGVLSYLLFEVMVFLVMVPFIIAAVLVATFCFSDMFIAAGMSFTDAFKAVSAEYLTMYLAFAGIMVIGLIPVMVYSYSVCLFPYLLIDNPEMGVGEAFRTSRRMMRGHKWQIFVLDLTFIGWMLLAILSCGIGCLWLAPYQNSARAHFYDELRAQEADEAV